MNKLILFFCLLASSAFAVTPTPTATPIKLGKVPLTTDISTRTGWSIVAGQLITGGSTPTPTPTSTPTPTPTPP